MTDNTREQLAANIRAAARHDNFLEQTTGADTHVTERHVVPIASLLERTLDPGENMYPATDAATFVDRKQAQTAINEITYAHADEIARYLVDFQNNTLENTTRQDRFLIEQRVGSIDPQPGVHLDNQSGHVNLFWSNDIALVIKPNTSLPLGIETLTAYPQHRRPSQDSTQSLVGYLQDLPVYDSAGPLKRAALELRCNPTSTTQVRLVGQTAQFRLPPTAADAGCHVSISLTDKLGIADPVLTATNVFGNVETKATTPLGSLPWARVKEQWPAECRDIEHFVTRCAQIVHQMTTEIDVPEITDEPAIQADDRYSEFE